MSRRKAPDLLSTLDRAGLVHRKLSADELGTIVSGSGWTGVTGGLPSGEWGNADMYPARVRGMYPNPGIYNAMARAEPGISSGLVKRWLTIASLNWDILPPQSTSSPTTTEEQEATDWIRSGWDEIDGGFLGAAVVRPASSDQYGFSVSEIVMDIDDATGLWKLVGLHWIPPWSIKGWVVDENGFGIGALLISENGGDDWLPWEKIFHVAEWFYGRNYEGISTLRSLYYTWQHKRQTLVDDATGRERAACGIIQARPPEGADRSSNAEDFANMETTVENIQTGSTGYIVLPANGWELEAIYLNSMPDNSNILAYLDHQIATQLTDNLAELGHTKFGARAVGSEMRLDKWAQLTGLCAMRAHNIDHKLHRPVWEYNGMDVRRMCRTTVNGLQSSEMFRRALEFLTTAVPENGSVIPVDDEIVDQLKRQLGFVRA